MPIPADQNPLSKKDLSDIKDALYKLSQRQPLIDLLEKCGKDTSECQAKAEYFHRMLTTLRNELFPETP